MRMSVFEMRFPVGNKFCVIWLLTALIASKSVCVNAAVDTETSIHTSRWREGAPGCSFSQGDDGKSRYGLRADDLDITVAIDSQELEKVRRRLEHVFSVQLTIRYRGTDAIQVQPSNFSLEFLTHHLVHAPLDPVDLSNRLQSDASAFREDSEREIRKRPEKQTKVQALLRTYQEDTTEMQKFLRASSLRPAVLDSGQSEVSGWVFFGTKDGRIGHWQKREDFVLRVPFADRVFEFPFTMPPSDGEPILRRRPSK